MREAVVIGGGPAGAATAALLARAGSDVLLIEKERAAHHKVCGEFISCAAARCLAALGLDPAALGAHAVGVLRVSSGAHEAETPLPFPAWSLSRLRLDEALLREAERSGASLLRGENVIGLAQEAGAWHVKTGRRTVPADTVFLASGKHDLRGWPRPRGRHGDMIGFKMHLRPGAAQEAALRGRVDLTFFGGGYAGLECVEDGVANLCLLIGREMYGARGGSWAGVVEEVRSSSRLFRWLLEGAEALWPKPLAVYGLPYGHLHRGAGTSLYHLGDQCAVIPSLAGEGMAMALHSAFTAVDCHLAGEGAGAYHRAVRRDFGRSVGLAGLVSALAGTRLLPVLLRAAPALSGKALYRLSGALRGVPDFKYVSPGNPGPLRGPS